MVQREFPWSATFEEFKSLAQELLEQCQRGDPAALELLEEFGDGDATSVSYESACEVLARSYGLESWERLTLSFRMEAMIHANDVAGVGALIDQHPNLLHESVRHKDSNWGAPMSYAANLGLDDMIRMLSGRGATDVQHAFGRACLQGQVETAKLLLQLGAQIERGVVMGCCETLNADGLALLMELGAEFCDEHGDRLAPAAMLLQTYSRAPKGKHRCLEIAADLGIAMPATATMAFHRGRIDLLEELLAIDPDLLHRRFSLRDFYPPALGCHDDITCGLHGTSLQGTTLLHMCADFDEMELAEWLIARGADVNAAAEVDHEGFGGHTPLFNAVVSQANICGRQRDASMTQLLLDHGADPKHRATVRKQLRFWEDETMHEYRDVTAAEYGDRFHAPQFSNPAAIQLLKAV